MRVMFRATLIGSLVLFGACGGGDSNGGDVSADAVVDTATDAPQTDVDATIADANPDSTAPDADASTPDGDVADDTGTCAQACLNEFGKNDKKLCPDPKSDWNCVAGCCVAVFKCGSNADCLAHGFEEGQCLDERFDCRCDTGTGVCSVWYCSQDVDCAGGELCAAGVCKPAPDTATWTLRIPERSTVLTTGAQTTVHAELWDAGNQDIVVGAQVTWSSSAEAVATVDAEGVITGGSEAGTSTIEAKTADGRTVSMDIRNVVPAAGDTYTVIAVEEGDLAPITGVYVLVDSAAGTLLANGDIPADGVIRYDGSETLIDVHVFGDSTDWVTWLNTAPGTLFLPTPRTFWGAVTLDEDAKVVPESTELIGANIVRGVLSMANYTKLGELELSLNSFAFSASLFDFNLQSIIGANVKRFFDPMSTIPGVDKTSIAEIPGGVTFGIEAPAIPDFVLAAPRGTHRVWSLGGRVRVEEVASFIGDIISAVSGGEFDFALIVRALVPLFGDFWTTVTPTPAFAGDGQPTVSVISPELRVPLGLATTLTLPTLPPMADLGPADSVFMISGALTPDGLMYPLGLTAGNDKANKDDAFDGIVDADPKTPAVDPFVLPSAPLHTGLGGPSSRYATATVAVNLSAGPSEPRPEGGSAVIALADPGAPLPAAQTVQPFLGFPMASTWDPTTRSATIEAVDGADVQRLLFKGEKGRNWSIWLNGSTSYTVPDPTSVYPSLVDRSLDFALLLVSSLDFAEGTTLGDVAAPGGYTLDTLLLSVQRASFLDIQRFTPAQ